MSWSPCSCASFFYLAQDRLVMVWKISLVTSRFQRQKELVQWSTQRRSSFKTDYLIHWLQKWDSDSDPYVPVAETPFRTMSRRLIATEGQVNSESCQGVVPKAVLQATRICSRQNSQVGIKLTQQLDQTAKLVTLQPLPPVRRTEIVDALALEQWCWNPNHLLKWACLWRDIGTNIGGCGKLQLANLWRLCQRLDHLVKRPLSLACHKVRLSTLLMLLKRRTKTIATRCA